MIQDIFPHRFQNQYDEDAVPAASDIVLCYQESKVLIKAPHSLPTVSDFPQMSLRYLFRIDGTCYFTPEQTVEESASLIYQNVRELRGASEIPKFHRYAIMTGKHLADWYRDSKFCGRCGRALHHAAGQRAMICDSCKKHFYPRIMPAVIVGVIQRKKDQILLTKYKTGISYYALVAGFTEIGETLEETVAREVLEETGLHVKNIRYYKSQPWGIANDILAGFFCEAEGDATIRMDASELKLAQWVNRKDVPLQPDDASLTNEMMQVFRDGKI